MGSSVSTDKEPPYLEGEGRSGKGNAAPCPSGFSSSRRQGMGYYNSDRPLRFHRTHGENIQLLADGAVARRTESFCKGLVFTSRTVKTNEYVFVKFSEVSTNWSGVIRFGFTSNDPSGLRPTSLPKYACPDLTARPGFWAKALPEVLVERDAILFYYVNQAGEVHYGINDVEKGVFFAGVDVRKPLWALLDVYGNTVGIELIDPRAQVLNNARANMESTTMAMESAREALQQMNIKRQHQHQQQLHQNFGGSSTDHSNDAFSASQYYPRTYFSPLPFHRVHGKNVQLSSDQLVASRREPEYSQGYVFTSRPLCCGEKIVVQVTSTTTDYLGSLAFGLTSCDPCKLRPEELPDDADLLLDRMEYWVVMKDVANAPKPGDELSFCINEQGQVLYSKNNAPPVTVMHVDQTQRLWAFFDIYGNTKMIRVLGCPVTSRNVGRSAAAQQTPLKVSLPPSMSGSHYIVPSSPTSSLNIPIPDASQDNAENECTVCCERPVNCVLYTCGHMCMCYECAKQMYERPSGQCPICRAEIRDVIRTFRA